MANSPAHSCAAQKSERIDGRLGHEHFDAFQRVQRFENSQQRFHSGAASRLQISQCSFGDTGLFGSGSLIQIFGEAEPLQLPAQATLEFRNGLEGKNVHAGIILPVNA
jgi:hypothetical protein